MEKIARLEGMATRTTSEFLTKEERLEKLRHERQEMEATLVKPAEETPAQRKRRLENWYLQEKLRREWGGAETHCTTRRHLAANAPWNTKSQRETQSIYSCQFLRQMKMTNRNNIL